MPEAPNFVGDTQRGGEGAAVELSANLREEERDPLL